MIHPVQRLYSWLEGFAETPHATVALFLCGFAEASILPLPSDVPLIALGVAKPRRAILYSLLVVVGASAGALVGYYVGSAFYEAFGDRIIEFVGAGKQFASLLDQYRVNTWLVLVLAGFTPIPFMVFTIAAGFNGTVDIGTLFFGVLCGRVLRFVPIGVILFFLGPRVKPLLERYLHRTVVVAGVALVLFLILVWNIR